MKKHILFLSLFIFVFASCDEGRLYQDRLIVPEEGRVVKLHVNMSGVDTWPDGYTVVLAGFNNEKEYSLIAKSIPNNGDVDLLMAGIGEEVTSIELCVTNRIRERVYSFYTQDFSTVDADTTQLDAGAIDAGMFNAVQQGIFIGRSCVGCHGTSTTAAAGLNLKEGVSYDGLVNRPSVVSPEWMRVSPGNSDESMLYQILASPISKEWGHDHSQEIESSIALEMLKDWIDSGAEE